MASGYRTSASDESIPLAFVLAMFGIPTVAMVFLLPAVLILPLINVGGLAAAAAAALFAWRAGPICDRQRITAWDVSGACALLGIAAGIFSDPHAILSLQLVMAP